MSDENTNSEEKTQNLSTQEKEKLLKELKERLKEIERLRAELGMKTEEKLLSTTGEKKRDENDDETTSTSPVTIGRVRAEVEELRVPALEMLDDKPMVKKKKEGTLV